jgi:uncharacterized alkaline shock family protein YloU
LFHNLLLLLTVRSFQLLIQQRRRADWPAGFNRGIAMSAQQKSLGTIDVAPRAVVTIVNHAVNQCYGVVGMASKNLVNGIARLLSRDPWPGIEVTVEADGITIAVYVIVEYGTPIRVVAESVQNTVKFHVEKTIGMAVKAVHVHVQGVRHDEDQESADPRRNKKQ